MIGYVLPTCLLLSVSVANIVPTGTGNVQTTPPPHTTIPTTIQIPFGSCRVNGKLYLDGESISKDPNGCFGMYCNDGGQVAWDHKCFLNPPVCHGTEERIAGQCCPVCHPIVPPTPPLPPTTTPPSTTTPYISTIPPGSCLVDGKLYGNGESISKDSNGCFGMYCNDGGQIAWDHKCFLNPPICHGTEERIAGQCCPVCHPLEPQTPPSPPTTPTTTPPSTTTPYISTIPPGSCLVGGKLYRDGDSISKDPNGCFGMYCNDGGQVAWDHHCFLDPPVCHGTEERIAGQCCLVCHKIPPTGPPPPPTTTPPSTTTPYISTIPPGSCFVGGKLYGNGESISKDPNGCFGMNCNDGGQVAWDHHCVLDPPICHGKEERIAGQCCLVCHQIPPTAPPPPPTTTPPSTTTHYITTILTGSCLVDGKFYGNGKSISKDPNGCFGMYCNDGGQVVWDHHCFLNPPICHGTEERIAGQCCPICHPIHPSTPPLSPTTIPPSKTTPYITTIPPGSCLVDGKLYRDGETINIDANGCLGRKCIEGRKTYWDHECAFKTPDCVGVLERVPGQCCPLCHVFTTTMEAARVDKNESTTLMSNNSAENVTIAPALGNVYGSTSTLSNSIVCWMLLFILTCIVV